MAGWEEYANQNAEFFILTRHDVDYSTPQGRAFFFCSGEAETCRSLGRIENLLPGRDRCIDFGCGIGRLALPHSRSFVEVYAVDISPTMLAKLRKRVSTTPYEASVNEPWDEEAATDYVYSFMVFQHIRDFDAIAEYLRRIRRTLKPTGIAQLHFDTRPPNALYHLKNLLPDNLLPPVYRRGIRRIRRSPAELASAFSGAGLKVVDASGVGGDQAVYVLTPG